MTLSEILARLKELYILERETQKEIEYYQNLLTNSIPKS